jgi:PAS domain S-box-containing protein
LTKVGLACVVCNDLRELAGEIAVGAGVVLLTDEATAAPDMEVLLETLSNQASWSDLAVVLLIQGGVPSPAVRSAIGSLSNVTLLERPAPSRSVLSAVQTAVRGRERQYEIRDQMDRIRRAEATAAELRSQLQLAVDSSELGTFHCKMPLGRIDWNKRCKIHFWLPEDAEIDFDLFYSILHPDDRERTRQAIDACVNDGKAYDVEYRTVSPRQEIRWVRATGRTTFDQNSRPLQFDGTTQDITDRKQAEEALKLADIRKDEFLATLAHELRNPLAPLRNSLHVLRLSGELIPAFEPMRDIMERQVEHMVHLIDDLLDVSRISRGKIELRKESVELATIVASAVETVNPLIDAAGHRLTISLPTEPVILNADPLRLSQIFSNLLNNAAKYTNSDGQIWLKARVVENEAAISIRDTGAGIPPDMLSAVFDMFSQVDRTLTRAQGGLGIGLTLTKTLVEMHGGRIEVHSEGTDRGSEFIVFLPIALDAKRNPPSVKPLQCGEISLTCRRILVVDDTSAARYVLGKLLEQLGQKVRTVSSAVAAIDCVREERPDLLISDIAMPNVDGYQLAKRLRKEPGMDDLLLVALTGYGQESDKQRANEAGFDFHLVKPVALKDLQDLLSNLP